MFIELNSFFRSLLTIWPTNLKVKILHTQKTSPGKKLQAVGALSMGLPGLLGIPMLGVVRSSVDGALKKFLKRACYYIP